MYIMDDVVVSLAIFIDTSHIFHGHLQHCNGSFFDPLPKGRRVLLQPEDICEGVHAIFAIYQQHKPSPCRFCSFSHVIVFFYKEYIISVNQTYLCDILFIFFQV